MSFYTVGRDGDDVVILTDAAQECAGLTRVTLTEQAAKDLARQLQFLLGVTHEARALPLIRDTERAPPRAGLDADAPAAYAAAEAAAGDNAELERRRNSAEAKREQRRVAMLGAEAERYMGDE